LYALYGLKTCSVFQVRNSSRYRRGAKRGLAPC